MTLKYISYLENDKKYQTAYYLLGIQIVGYNIFNSDSTLKAKERGFATYICNIMEYIQWTDFVSFVGEKILRHPDSDFDEIIAFHLKPEDVYHAYRVSISMKIENKKVRNSGLC